MNSSVSISSGARPILIPRDHTQSILQGRDFESLVSRKASLDERPDRYQVALVPMGWEDGSIARDSEAPRVLLLPLTWDDLLSHVHHSDSANLLSKSASNVAQFGDLRVDFARHETRRAGKPVNLTAFELKVLKFLVSNPYRVVSRAELLDTVWGYDCYPTTRTVDNHILRLRQKIEHEPANPVHIRTVYGAGYKFVP